MSKHLLSWLTIQKTAVLTKFIGTEELERIASGVVDYVDIPTATGVPVSRGNRMPTMLPLPSEIAKAAITARAQHARLSGNAPPRCVITEEQRDHFNKCIAQAQADVMAGEWHSHTPLSAQECRLIMDELEALEFENARLKQVLLDRRIVVLATLFVMFLLMDKLTIYVLLLVRT